MQDRIRAELPNELTLRSDDSKSEPQNVDGALQPEQLLTCQTDPELPTGPSDPTLSQNPAAVKSRAYRQKLREGRAGTRTSQGAKRPLSQKPLWTAEQIREKLRKWDRSPFMDLVAAWLECAPTPEALVSFADRFPDRYAASLLALSRVAGFADKKEITADVSGTVIHRVEEMSDSQLEDHLRDLAYKMGIPVPQTLQLIEGPASPDGVPSAVPSGVPLELVEATKKDP